MRAQCLRQLVGDAGLVPILVLVYGTFGTAGHPSEDLQSVVAAFVNRHPYLRDCVESALVIGVAGNRGRDGECPGRTF